MKKLIALLLAAIMVMAIFVGCSSKTAETPSTDTPAADTPAADTPAATTDAPPTSRRPKAKPMKIGFIGWGYTDGLGSAYQRYLDYVAPYVGMEIVYGQYKTAEDIISQAESLIQAGCQRHYDDDCQRFPDRPVREERSLHGTVGLPGSR